MEQGLPSTASSPSFLKEDGYQIIADPVSSLQGQSVKPSSSLFRQEWQLLQRWWTPAYLADYAICIILLALSGLFSGYIPPFTPIKRWGPVAGDPTVSFPVLSDIVPSWLAVVLCSVLCVVCFFAMQFVNKISLHDIHHSIMGLAQTIALNQIATNVLKIIAGRPRPFYLTLCAAQNVVVGQEVTDEMCSKDVNWMKLTDARMSFPSGHSSFSFCTMIFLTLYLLGKFELLAPQSIEGRRQHDRDNNNIKSTASRLKSSRLAKCGSTIVLYLSNRSRPFWKLCLALLPLVLAAFIATSRTIDFHHNYSDVLAGSCLGVFCGVIGYFYTYHSPLSRLARSPKVHYKFVGNTIAGAGSAEDLDDDIKSKV